MAEVHAQTLPTTAPLPTRTVPPSLEAQLVALTTACLRTAQGKAAELTDRMWILKVRDGGSHTVLRRPSQCFGLCYLDAQRDGSACSKQPAGYACPQPPRGALLQTAHEFFAAGGAAPRAAASAGVVSTTIAAAVVVADGDDGRVALDAAARALKAAGALTTLQIEALLTRVSRNCVVDEAGRALVRDVREYVDEAVAEGAT